MREAEIDPHSAFRCLERNFDAMLGTSLAPAKRLLIKHPDRLCVNAVSMRPVFNPSFPAVQDVSRMGVTVKGIFALNPVHNTFRGDDLQPGRASLQQDAVSYQLCRQVMVVV